MEEHPVWRSLDALLDSQPGEEVALQYLTDSELTSLEFLSACAAQAPFISSWAKRIEVYKAARIAIAKDPKRVYGFAESLFKELLNFQPFEDDSVEKLVELYIDSQRLINSKIATESLLKCLYDPLVTRIRTTEIAQRLGRRIIHMLEHELGTFTVQKILLYPSFREREELEEGGDTSDSSLTAWQNTTDSTESSLDEHTFGCPPESSAAAAWVLAPSFLDPPVLTSFGQYSWGMPHVKFLIKLPSNTLAARRGFELFSSFGAVTFPPENRVSERNFVSDACEMLKDVFKFVMAEQSLEGRDAIGSFMLALEPFQLKWNLLASLTKDITEPPTVRGYMLDLIRKETLKNDKILMFACALGLTVLESNGDDDQIATGCFSILHSIGARAQRGHAKCLEAARKHKERVQEVVLKVVAEAREQETEISDSDKFQLKAASPFDFEDGQIKHRSTSAISKPPAGYGSAEAANGRARLIAGTAEMLLNLYNTL